MSYLINKFGNLFISLNKFLWNKTPLPVRQSAIGYRWGRMIFRLVEIRGGRQQLTTTYFFRNRPELSLLTNITKSIPAGNPIKLTVIGCSQGAEVLSILHSMRAVTPLSSIEVNAYDINTAALTTAKSGHYKKSSRSLELATEDEITTLFDATDEEFIVKQEYQDRIKWHLLDLTSPENTSKVEKQDIVFANRFLFHMKKPQQITAIKTIASIIKPGGYIFVSGVDLDIRTRLAMESKWENITDYLEEIHGADSSMIDFWPFEYWGLEPINKNHKDWMVRYCSVFKVPQ